MLLFETEVRESQIKGLGLGLFTLVKIKKGAKYWIRDEDFDRVISLHQLNSLMQIGKDYVEKYGFQETSKNWYLCGDNARFTNHSEDPNTAQYFDGQRRLQYGYALRDIEVEEEILLDYSDLCLTMTNGVFWK